MYQLRTFVCLVLFGTLLVGCATPGPGTRQPWCAIGGALVGAGAGWAVDYELLDDDTEEGQYAAGAIGAVIGASAASILCAERKPPEPVPVAAPEPEPVKPCAMDPDGDGVMGDGELGCPDKCPNTPMGVEVDSDGCPRVGEVLLILEGVNFAFDSAKLTSESEAILDQAVKALKDASTVTVRVEGHTDSVGSEQYNLRLSQRRAEAVVEYLVSQGVEPGRVEPAGYGESQPTASNATEEGRHKNRRVEFEVISK
jgi:OOP family OmpA-OmpF porin